MERVPETIEKSTLEIFSKVGAVITDSHIVYTSGQHGSAYVNKDEVYPYTEFTKLLCQYIGAGFTEDKVEVVVAPAVGGINLSQGVAHFLTRYFKRNVLSIYAEHEQESILKAEENTTGIIVEAPTLLKKSKDQIFRFLNKGDELIIKKKGFVIGRNYKKYIPGKRILIVEDIITTGGSVKGVIEAVRKLDGNIIGVGVLCNRNPKITEKELEVPKLIALTNIPLEKWDEDKCPFCARNVPINTDVGKGKDFLARKQAN